MPVYLRLVHEIYNMEISRQNFYLKCTEAVHTCRNKVLSPGRNCLYLKRGRNRNTSIMFGTKVESIYCIFGYIHMLLWDKTDIEKNCLSVVNSYTCYTYVDHNVWIQYQHTCTPLWKMLLFLYTSWHEIVVRIISSLTERAVQCSKKYISLCIPFLPLVYALTQIWHYTCGCTTFPDGKHYMGKNLGLTCWIWWHVVATITV